MNLDRFFAKFLSGFSIQVNASKSKTKRQRLVAPKSRKILLPAAMLGIVFVGLISYPKLNLQKEPMSWWEVQSVDTMKYSRDVAREKLWDDSFDQTIDQQVKNIAEIGATHVAIGTPYDEEFIPFMKRWVRAARRHGLSVWFRGNWSGWQEWFEYPRINRSQHIEKTKQFVLTNKTLFEDGDIFTSCPECENGGPGDPRHNKDLIGHRKFLIDEYQAAKEAFEAINKDVASNYFSMNGDVARLVMDKETTQALDEIVVIDHYVASTTQLAVDIKEIAAKSGGRVVLGEFGAPIPDIHGRLSEDEQAEWIQDALFKISQIPELHGVNYWVNVGGSTQLWDSSGVPKKATESLQKYYAPNSLEVIVKNVIGFSIGDATITRGNKNLVTNSSGQIELAMVPSIDMLTISAEGYKSTTVEIEPDMTGLTVTLIKEREGVFFRLIKFLRQIFKVF